MLRKIILRLCAAVTALFSLLTAVFVVGAPDNRIFHIGLSALFAWITWYLWQRIKSPPGAPPADRAPFLSRFGDTFKLPTSYADKREAMLTPCDLSGNGNFDFEVVGESHYRTTIWASIPGEYSKAERFRLYFIFTLQMEDDNEHDKNAVAVQIKGTIGYLPRDFAKRYRRWANSKGLGSTATCRGVVVANESKDYSVWLDLPDELA